MKVSAISIFGCAWCILEGLKVQTQPKIILHSACRETSFIYYTDKIDVGLFGGLNGVDF